MLESLLLLCVYSSAYFFGQASVNGANQL